MIVFFQRFSGELGNPKIQNLNGSGCVGALHHENIRGL